MNPTKYDLIDCLIVIACLGAACMIFPERNLAVSHPEQSQKTEEANGNVPSLPVNEWRAVKLTSLNELKEIRYVG